MLVSDLTSSALRLIGGGTFASGETPSTSETADAVIVLNQMLEAWSATQLLVPNIINVTKALSAATQTYTIGPGGSINTNRPLKIESAGIISGGLRQDLELISKVKWSKIRERALTGVLPLQMYNDNAYPLATLSLWPIPSGTPTLDLWIWARLTSVAGTGTVSTSGTAVTWVSGSTFDAGWVGITIRIGSTSYTVSAVGSSTTLTLSATAGIQAAAQFTAPLPGLTLSLPEAYARALRYNLAVELAAEYGLAATEDVRRIAMESKAEIVTLNTSNALANLPSDLPPNPGEPA